MYWEICKTFENSYFEELHGSHYPPFFSVQAQTEMAEYDRVNVFIVPWMVLRKITFFIKI